MPKFKQVSLMRRSAQASQLLGTIAVVYAAAVAVLYLAGRSPRHRAEAACYIAAALLGLAALLQVGRHNNDCPATKQSPGTSWAVLLGLLLLSAAFFGGTLGIGLLSDDFVLLDRAGRGFVTAGNELFRPAPQLIWVAAERAFDVSAPFLHALNVVLHGTNAWLVFVLATLMGLKRLWAMCAAGLFLISPACVETVVWLSALFDVCLVSGSLLFAIGSLKHSWAMAFIGLALALLAKETATIAPFLGAVVSLACGGSLRIPIWGAIVTAVFVAARLWILPPPDSYWVEPSGYVIKEMVSRVFGSLAVPWTSGDLAMLRVLPIMGILSIAAIIIVGVQRPMTKCIVARLGALMFWIAIAVVPIYGGFYVSPTLEGARYLYLPCVGWSLLIVVLASQGWEKMSARPVVVVAIVMLLATSAIGVVRHQRPWVEAAALREQVLASARVAAATRGCPSIDVRNPPESVEGAYVFRNGIREALVRANINAGRDDPRMDCRFEWSAGGLVPIDHRK